MYRKTPHEKRQAIFLLMSGSTQKSVATRFKIQQSTISKWQQSEDFKQLREEMLDPIKERYPVIKEVL